MLGHHGLWGKGPFHLEDLLRVPFAVRWPGRVPDGRRIAALQSLVDLSPTLLRAAGGELPGRLAGVDQLDVWMGRSAEARDAVLVDNRVSDRLRVLTRVGPRHKVTVHLPGGEGELYDLETDPGEMVNLWAEPTRAGLARDLAADLLAAMGTLEGPLPPRVGYA